MLELDINTLEEDQILVTCPDVQIWELFQFQYTETTKNGSHFVDDIFKCIFLNAMVLLGWKFHWQFNWPLIRQHCSDNCLAPNRWQVNIWTSDSLVHSLMMNICVTRWVNDTGNSIWRWDNHQTVSSPQWEFLYYTEATPWLLWLTLTTHFSWLQDCFLSDSNLNVDYT